MSVARAALLNIAAAIAITVSFYLGGYWYLFHSGSEVVDVDVLFVDGSGYERKHLDNNFTRMIQRGDCPAVLRTIYPDPRYAIGGKVNVSGRQAEVVAGLSQIVSRKGCVLHQRPDDAKVIYVSDPKQEYGMYVAAVVLIDGSWYVESGDSGQVESDLAEELDRAVEALDDSNDSPDRYLGGSG